VTGLDDVAWPVERAGEALTALAAAADLAPRPVDAGAPTVDRPLAAWLEDAGRWLGVDVEPVDAPLGDVDALVVAGPALLLLPAGAGVVALLAGRGRRAAVLDPAGGRARVPRAALRDALAAPAAAPARAEARALVAGAGIRGRRADRAARAVVEARLRDAPIGGVVLLRLAAEASPWRLAAGAAIGSRLAAAVLAFALAHALWIAAWWTLGRGVVSGALAPGWLLAWGLLVVTSTAGRQGATWLAERVAIDAGALVRRRLLAGALRVDPDRLRQGGIGGALARVLESGSFEALGVGGAIGTAFGAVELVVAAAVLSAGAGGALLVALLALAIAVVAAAARRTLRARQRWTDLRLAITHDLVEVMIGHETRLAQLAPALQHEREDAALARYAGASAVLDRAQRDLAILPRLWPLAAVAGLAAPLLLGDASSTGVAIALGGILLAQRALAHVAAGAGRLVEAAAGWRAIAPLLRAGGTAPEVAPPGLAGAAPSPGAPVLTLRGIEYRHRGRGQPVLAGCDLVVARGDRIRLEGTSGAGKSTLGAIAGGVRISDSGLALAGGLDRPSLGADGWRRRVAYAPQFHDNHLLSAPLAFNLLVARAWPPSPADLSEAEAICRELGLGDLLARMPGGIYEMVGETGWRLSHGETSRVFLARALLQGADLVVLDESLAALDAEAMAQVLRCIETRAPAAIVVAHP
jgi:ATP-binding cassette subfamily B protein